MSGGIGKGIASTNMDVIAYILYMVSRIKLVACHVSANSMLCLFFNGVDIILLLCSYLNVMVYLG